MYPGLPGGWKCCLQAAVSHHKRPHASTLGHSPQYAAFGEPAYLPADDILGITEKLHLKKMKKSSEQQQKHREVKKRAFDNIMTQIFPQLH